MIELFVRPLADAFMQVGVFVALLVAPFGWARYRWGHRLDATLLRHRRLGPLVAAFLTMPPGCGGAIIVVALYARGAVSYGAAIAALVATMGDATWVLLAAEPVLTLQLKLLLLGTGATAGYVVDALRIAPRRKIDQCPPSAPPAAQPPPVRTAGTAGLRPAAAMRSGSEPAGGVLVGAGGVAVLDRAATVRLQEVGVLSAALWALLCTGAVISLPVTFQLLDPAEVGRTLFGGVDPYLALGLMGTALAVVAFVRGGCKLADDDTRSAHPTSGAQVLRHGGHEVAFVTVWVAVAYLSWSVVTHLTGFDGSSLPLFGLIGVVVGATIGLIPGCGVQIVFTGIFLAGGMPLSTLVANTISQDGDALLPMLALEHRSALLATVLTTIPAIIVGAGILLLS